MTPNQPSGEAAGRPRQATDKDIFDALTSAITEEGPHRWTLNGVASRIGLTGPALGYRFGSKHGLLLAFAAHQPNAAATHFDNIAATADSPHEAIIDALVGLVSEMTSRTHVANNVAMLSLDLTDDDLAQSARAQTRTIKAKLNELVAQCEPLPVADPTVIAEHLYVTWSGAIIAWAIDGTDSLANWTRQHIETALQQHEL